VAGILYREGLRSVYDEWETLDGTQSSLGFNSLERTGKILCFAFL